MCIQIGLNEELGDDTWGMNGGAGVFADKVPIQPWAINNQQCSCINMVLFVLSESITIVCFPSDIGHGGPPGQP